MTTSSRAPDPTPTLQLDGTGRDGVSRRSFLKIMAAVGGGLSVGFLTEGCSHVKGAQSLGGGFHPNAWLHISNKDKITFFLDRAEMGQGVVTSHAQLIAEELEVPADRIHVEFAPADYDRFGVQLTGGSTSVTSQFDVLRQAGATAREVLKQAAAKKWEVPVTEVRAENGAVHHASKGKLTYGELADLAANESAGEVELKDPSQWKVIGKPVPRLDAPAKVDGSAVFGIDVQVPGMLTAIVLRPPVLRGKVKSFDGSKALTMPGVKHVVDIPQGVAVVATGYWQARKASQHVTVQWDDGPMGSFSSERLAHTHRTLLKNDAKVVSKSGDYDTALASAPADKRVRAVYEVPFVAHATMEPMNATAHVEADRCRVWAGNQSPTIVKDAVARLVGMRHDQVEINTTYMGGGFGRRALADFVVEAVEISRKVKAPVKVVWSREDDTQRGQYRPASTSLIEGAVGADGMPVAWFHRMAGQSLVTAFADMLGALAPEMVPRPLMDFLGAGLGKMFVDGHLIDPTAVEGASDHPYKIEHQRVELAMYESGIPAFTWRSVGHSINAFVVESFIDELAHVGKKDPLELRRALLVDHPRRLAVLNAAAKGIGWETKPAAGIYRGIAQHHCFGSYCAHAIEISLDKERGLKLHRVVSAIDCGRVVNPDIVAAQMESGVIYALSAAWKQKIDFEKGRVRQSNFHDHPLLRHSESPHIETIIIPSTEHPSGVGELGVPPVAPALANAIFAATGVRLRRLPLGPDVDLVLQGKKPQEITL